MAARSKRRAGLDGQVADRPFVSGGKLRLQLQGALSPTLSGCIKWASGSDPLAKSVRREGRRALMPVRYPDCGKRPVD